MTVFYDSTANPAGLQPNALGGALVQLPPLVFSHAASFVWSWTLQATDGNPLTSELSDNTYEYIVVADNDPNLTAVRTHTGASGIVVTPSAGVFVFGDGTSMDAGSYLHFLRATATSSGYKTLFFEGRVVVRPGVE